MVDCSHGVRYVWPVRRNTVLQHSVLLRLLPKKLWLGAESDYAGFPLGGFGNYLGRPAADTTLQSAKADHRWDRFHCPSILRVQRHEGWPAVLLSSVLSLYHRLHLLGTHPSPDPGLLLVPQDARQGDGHRVCRCWPVWRPRLVFR